MRTVPSQPNAGRTSMHIMPAGHIPFKPGASPDVISGISNQRAGIGLVLFQQSIASCWWLAVNASVGDGLTFRGTYFGLLGPS